MTKKNTEKISDCTATEKQCIIFFDYLKQKGSLLLVIKDFENNKAVKFWYWKSAKFVILLKSDGEFM